MSTTDPPISYSTRPAPRRTHPLKIALLGVWLAGTVGSFALLARYKGTPGAMQSAGAEWPGESAIVRSRERATLVMFAHPMCPCTRASLAELRKLAGDARGRVDVHVVVMLPEGAPKEWEESGIVALARGVPGAIVSFDRGGREAKRFGAATSGDVSVYDAAGARRYHGGITPARGHEGVSAGLVAALAAVRGEASAAATGRVFGCELDSPVAAKDEVKP